MGSRRYDTRAAVERRRLRRSQRYPAIAKPESVGLESHIGGVQPERLDGPLDGQGWNGGVAHAHERDAAPRDAVGIEREQIVAGAT